MRVGIGILSYNRPDSLTKCLDSLFDNLDLPAQVAVSFDLWNRDFQSIAEHYPIWAISGSQRGIPAANNRLLKFFEAYDAIFLVQDDIRFLRPEWLETYLQGLAVVPYLSFFDPYYPPDPSRPRHFKANYFKRRQQVIRDGVRLWLCHKSPQGAFQAISRACVERVGHFDPGFGTYGIEHHDYWLRTCNAGFSPAECFYDVEQSVELLKIDWKQPPSLAEEEKNAASKDSRRWRHQLFGPSGRGFQRIKVIDDKTDVIILQQGPTCEEMPFRRRTFSELLSTDHWLYPTRIPVISYHAIDEAPGDRYAVSPHQFKAHIRELAQHLTFVTAAQAARLWKKDRRFPRGIAVLTFDDGYQDFLSIAPFLAELKIKATIFVPTGWVGRSNTWDRAAFKKRKHLGWQALCDAIAMGHEIGSHGIEHRRLTMLPPDEATQEVIESKHQLMQHLNQPVRTIAYPFGGVNGDIAQVVRMHYDAGFVAGGGGTLDWHEDPCLIRRIVVGANQDPRGLLTRIANYMTEAPLSEPVWAPTRSSLTHLRESRVERQR